MTEHASVLRALQERAHEVDPKTGTLLKAAANVIRDLERRVSSTPAANPVQAAKLEKQSSLPPRK